MITDFHPTTGAFTRPLNQPLAKVQVAGAVADLITLFSSFDAYEARNDIYTEIASFHEVAGRPGTRVLRATKAAYRPSCRRWQFLQTPFGYRYETGSDWHKCTDFVLVGAFDD